MLSTGRRRFHNIWQVSPDRVSVHHHDEVMQRLGQLRGQLGAGLQRLLAGEVEDVLPGHVVVDDGHAVVVAHEGGHGGGRPVDGVGVVSLGPGPQQQRADVRLGRQTREVETRVVMLVVPAVGVSTWTNIVLRSIAENAVPSYKQATKH